MIGRVLTGGAAAMLLIVGAAAVSASGNTAVGGDQVALAQELVDAKGAGKLTVLSTRHWAQVVAIASGTSTPDCGIDVRILQVMVIATRTFDRVGVSDINRRCTHELYGAGVKSAHYIDGGGHAVDFYSLDGRALTGADSGSLRLISTLDPIIPTGSRVGQSDCRAAAGTTISTRMTQFEDSCDHLHIDVAWADGPLTP